MTSAIMNPVQLGASEKKLAKRIDDAPVIMVRSQEIDAVGEGGFGLIARTAMDNVIDNLAFKCHKPMWIYFLKSK